MPRLSWNEIEHRAVDRLYQRSPFATDADRVAMLFTRYQELSEG